MPKKPALKVKVTGDGSTSIASATPAKVTAGPLTLNVQGGMAPYSFGWEIESGAGFALAPTGNTCTVTATLGAGQSASGSVRGVVTDKRGFQASASLPVALSNVAVAPAPTPEPTPAPIPAPEPIPAPPSPPSPGGSYPLAVINSGTQLAWDLQLPGAVGPRTAPAKRVGVDALPMGAAVEYNSVPFLGIHGADPFDGWLFDMAFNMGCDNPDADQVFNDCRWVDAVSLLVGGRAGGNYTFDLATKAVINHGHFASTAFGAAMAAYSGGLDLYRTLCEGQAQQVYSHGPKSDLPHPAFFRLRESVIRNFAQNPGLGAHIEALFIQVPGEVHLIDSLIDCSGAPTPPPNGAGWTGVMNGGGDHVYVERMIFMGLAALNAIHAMTIGYIAQTGGPVFWHVKNCALSRGCYGYFADVGTPRGVTIVDEGGNYDFDTGGPINVSMTPP